MMEILACPIDKHYPLEIFETKTSGDTIIEGAMYCQTCSRYYPIMEEIPIMLPDELRNKKQEIDFLTTYKEKLPEKIIKQGNPWHLWTILVTNFISEKAKIGKNVKIWHFTYVGDDVEIGDNVKIGSLSHVDYNVRIGENTLIEGLVYIPPLSRIGKNVFIGPSATLTNDPYPPSGKMIGVTIEDGAVIGSRAVIKSGVTIGKNSVVAMGAVVTKDVPENSVVIGVPAKVKYSREEYNKKQKDWQES